MSNEDDLPATQTPREVCQEADICLGDMLPWGQLLPVNKSVRLQAQDLIAAEITLGRAPNCTIVINEERFPLNQCFNISKLHFRIRRPSATSGGQAILWDLSKNGTFINSNLVGRNCNVALSDGDCIAIGEKLLTVFLFKYVADLHQDVPDELREKYFVSRLLGHGAFGEVYLAYERMSKNGSHCRLFAIKRMKRKSSDLDVNITREINIMQELRHPLVICLRDLFMSPHNGEVFIVLDYMKGGDLTKLLTSTKQPLTCRQTKFIFYQIVLGVNYLHGNGITHRDIKPENVLLSDQRPECIVKITDFGLSKFISDESILNTVCGTPHYVAPEVLDANCSQYDQQVDVWSMGVLLHLMLTRHFPFDEKERLKLQQSILKAKVNWTANYWRNVEQFAISLLNEMLQRNARHRITIDGILKHEWIVKDKKSMHTQLMDLLGKSTVPDDYISRLLLVPSNEDEFQNAYTVLGENGSKLLSISVDEDGSTNSFPSKEDCGSPAANVPSGPHSFEMFNSVDSTCLEGDELQQQQQQSLDQRDTAEMKCASDDQVNDGSSIEEGDGEEEEVILEEEEEEAVDDDITESCRWTNGIQLARKLVLDDNDDMVAMPTKRPRLHEISERIESVTVPDMWRY